MRRRIGQDGAAGKLLGTGCPRRSLPTRAEHAQRHHAKAVDAPADGRFHFFAILVRLKHRAASGPLQDLAFFEGFALLSAIAWRTSALKADSSTTSPSWMSIARRTFPSRLELKRRPDPSVTRPSRR